MRAAYCKLIAGLMVVLASSLPAKDVPDYAIGETVREDIVTPVPLVVLNPVETSALKAKEASRVPVICRYYTNAIDQAEREFDLAFDAAHRNFLDKLETAFKQRTLDAASIGSPIFDQVVASFQKQNKTFPLTTNLAGLWARGEPDAALRGALRAKLQEAMSQAIRPANIATEVRFGATIRLVPLAGWNDVPTLEQAEQQGLNFSRSNIVTFTRIRDQLLESFPIEERPTAKFLASFLKTNCVPDVELTTRARSLRTDPVWAADHYDAGQVLAKQGSVVDQKLQAALDQLREKTAVASLEEKQREDAVRAEAAAQRRRWTITGWGVGAALLGAALLGVAKRQRARSLLPARIAGEGAGATIVSCPSCAETIVVPNPAPEPAGAVDLRARLAPHLARLLMDKLVRRLLSQRTGMLDTQEKAVADMAELEARLEKIHAPLQDRLRAYEQRISELERELALKGQENRELIKFKITLVRNQLAAAKDRLELN